MADEWRDIAGFEGRYKISRAGEIYSIPRTVKFGVGHRTVGGKTLKPRPDVNGYLTVMLSDSNDISKRKPVKVHRLVAAAFIENPFNYPCVNHKDENKRNNNADNLEWCTVEYNNNYGTHQERSIKSRINNPKISMPILCVETGETYPSMHEVERQTGIDQSQIWHCIKYPWKTARGKHWVLAEGGG